MIVGGTGIMSVDLTPGNFDAKVRFDPFTDVEGDFNHMHTIFFTNKVTYTKYDDGSSLAPVYFQMFVYDYYNGIEKVFNLAKDSEFSYNKYGSPWILTCSWDSGNLTVEIFDHTV
jgi:hypothetical protein